MKTINNLQEKLNYYIPNPNCELNYQKDYELLIATVLSAQCTDKRVNEVTKVLFNKYDLKSLANADINDIEKIIRSCGSYTKKANYLIQIAKRLVLEQKGVVPNNRDYIESLPGAGRKTCNVVLKNLFNEPSIPVDTHVERVSKRLGFVNNESTPFDTEKKLMQMLPKSEWNRVSEQLLLFGRYYCKSSKPSCQDCLFYQDCHYEKKNS